MNSIAVAQKCVREIFADRRTVMLILVMPLIVLTLVFLLFNGSKAEVNAGYVGDKSNIKANYSDVNYREYENKDEAITALENEEIDGIVIFDTLKEPVNLPEQFQMMSGQKTFDVDKPTYSIITAGQDPINEPNVRQAIIDSLDVDQSVLMSEKLNDNYDMEDYLTIYLMEFVIFFFTFLIVGMSFLKERKNATLQRMLTYDISRFSIVSGYLLGFGFIAVIQTILIQLYSIYVLDIYIVGNIGVSIIVNIIFAFVAISLGSLISTLANTEFQVMQFIPIVLLPQIIFCGIFPYGDWYQTLSNIFPLTWAFKAQDMLLLKNDPDVILYAIILLTYVLIFTVINLLILRKTRRI